MTREAATTSIYGLGYALAASGAWGLGVVITKAALQFYSPLCLFLLQVSTSMVCLGCVAFVRRRNGHPSIRQAIRQSWLGALEPGLAYVLATAGLARIAASRSSIISATESMLIVLVACAIDRRLPRWGFVSRAIICFFALAAFLANGSVKKLGASDLFGDALVWGGALSAAIYVVLNERAVRAAPSDALLLFVQQGAGLVVGMLGFLLEGVLGQIHAHFTVRSLALALGGGVVQYACAFLLFFQASRRATASALGVVLNMIPICGVLGGVLFLRESLSTLQWLCAAGVTVTVATQSLAPQTD